MSIEATHGNRKIEIEYSKDDNGYIIPERVTIRKEDEKYGTIEVIVDKKKITVKANSFMFEVEGRFVYYLNNRINVGREIDEFMLRYIVNGILSYLIDIIPNWIDEAGEKLEGEVC